jgi:hypothetical protein
MPPPFPAWSIPHNLSELIDADGHGIWDDEATFAPITLSVMKDVVFGGRPIELSWQIEFEPDGDQFDVGNERLEGLGLDADGYGWATLIQSVIRKYHPAIADELQFGDTEEATCVVWVESENTCRTLTEVVWNLIHS